MKPRSGTSETRRNATATGLDVIPEQLIAHAGPGVARPGDRGAMLAARLREQP
jgi:hypothetical protein